MKVKGVSCEQWKWGKNAVSQCPLTKSFLSPDTLCPQYQKFSPASRHPLLSVAELSDSLQALHLCSWQGHSMCYSWQKAIYVLILMSSSCHLDLLNDKLSLSFHLWEFGILSAVPRNPLFHKTCRSLVSWRLVASVRFGWNLSSGSKSHSPISLDPRGNLAKMYHVRSVYHLLVWVIWDFDSKTCLWRIKVFGKWRRDIFFWFRV